MQCFRRQGGSTSIRGCNFKRDVLLKPGWLVTRWHITWGWNLKVKAQALRFFPELIRTEDLWIDLSKVTEGILKWYAEAQGWKILQNLCQIFTQICWLKEAYNKAIIWLHQVGAAFLVPLVLLSGSVTFVTEITWSKIFFSKGLACLSSIWGRCNSDVQDGSIHWGSWLFSYSFLSIVL